MSQIILFDLDGTLTESGEGITKSVQYALSHFGIIENDLQKLRCFVGPPLKDQFVNYAGLSQEQAEQAVEYYRERYNSIGIFENRLYPKIKELLELLKVNDKVLGVASSKPEIYVEQILKHFGIDSYFQVAVGSELDGRRARKSEVIEEALRRLGMDRARDSVLMVGDREHDVDGARDCGIQCIGVAYGYGTREELEKAGAVYIAETVEDLGILASPNDEETTEHVESVRGVKNRHREHKRKKVQELSPVKQRKESEKKPAKEPQQEERQPLPGNRLVKDLWNAVYPIIIHYGISILVTMGMIAVFLLADRYRGLTEDPVRTATEVQEHALYQILITSAVSAIVMFCLYRRDQKKRKAGFLGGAGLDPVWNPPVMWMSVLVLGIVGSQMGNDIIALLQLRKLFPGYDISGQSAMAGQPLWLLILSIGMLSPIAEELLFRGLLFGRLKDWMKPGIAIGLSSLFFGIYHGNVVQFVYALLLGSLFAVFYYRTGTLWSAVAAHMGANVWSLCGSQWFTGLFAGRPVLTALKILIEIFLAVIPAYWIIRKKKTIRKK